MTLPELPRIAYWLVPQQPDRRKLQSMIADLACRFAAPLFVPHVTLYSCRRSSNRTDLSAMAHLAATSQLLTMRVDRLECKEKLTQALFVKLHNNAAATALSNRLRAAVSQPSHYEFDPHLSLLYQQLPTTLRQRVAEEMPFHLEEIIFTELWAVAIPDQLQTIETFYGWQLLLTARLAVPTIVDTIEARY